MARSSTSTGPDLVPVHPPKMGRGKQAKPIPKETLDAWVSALNDSEKFPEGVGDKRTYEKRGAAASRAQKLKSAITEYADLGETTKIRTRVWQDDDKKWHFGLQLRTVEPEESEDESGS